MLLALSPLRCQFLKLQRLRRSHLLKFYGRQMTNITVCLTVITFFNEFHIVYFHHQSEVTLTCYFLTQDCPIHIWAIYSWNGLILWASELHLYPYTSNVPQLTFSYIASHYDWWIGGTRSLETSFSSYYYLQEISPFLSTVIDFKTMASQ